MIVDLLINRAGWFYYFVGRLYSRLLGFNTVTGYTLFLFLAHICRRLLSIYDIFHLVNQLFIKQFYVL
jgi:hypothetical protein